MGEANSACWDAGAMAQFIAACRPIAKVWFRPEVRGLDTFPPGGALVVSNHSGGLLTTDTLISARLDREQIFDAVAAERRRIADLLDALDEDALATPSLCTGWDVKTVAAHLVSVFADSFWAFQRAAIRYSGFNRAIDELARRRARTPAADIARTLRQRADHRLNPPVTGPLSGLTDVLVHGGDIQIPSAFLSAPKTSRWDGRWTS